MAIRKARSRAGNWDAFGPSRPKSVIASEAKQSRAPGSDWIASSQELLAMTSSPPSRKRVDLLVGEIAGHDGDRNREGADRLGHDGDDRPRSLRAGIGRQHQHRDVDVLVDHVEQLLGGIALADHALGGYRGDAVGAAGGAVEC